MALTLRFLRSFHLLFYRKRFPGVYNVDYCTRSCGFEVLQECSGVTTVGVGGIYTLRREVIKLLKVGVPMRN